MPYYSILYTMPLYPSFNHYGTSIMQTRMTDYTMPRYYPKPNYIVRRSCGQPRKPPGTLNPKIKIGPGRPSEQL